MKPQTKIEDSPETPVAITIHSFIHFAAGFIFTFVFGISLFVSIFIHVCFEFLENTEIGINILSPDTNAYDNLKETFKTMGLGWKKYKGDSAMNSNMDTILFSIGAMLGKIFDDMIRRRKR